MSIPRSWKQAWLAPLALAGVTLAEPIWPQTLASIAGQKIVVDGIPVESKADPPCYPVRLDDPHLYSRFFDCDNGTVLDAMTGLLWTKWANCLFNLSGDDGRRSWYRANAWVRELRHGICALTDHSQPGDWRLPSSTELETILKPSCSAPKIVGRKNGCHAAEEWALALSANNQYWSSTVSSTSTQNGLIETLIGQSGTGFVDSSAQGSLHHVWAVRSGQ